MASTAFNTGFVTTLGVILAIGVAIAVGAAIYTLVEHIITKYKHRGDKAKFVLNNWKTYIAKGYFEELQLLNKYKKELEKGEWPDELADKFEWSDFGKGADTNNWGEICYYRKSFLTLKNKYKKDKEKAEEPKETESKDNKDDDK